MTSPTDLADCTATELLALYRRRQASPVDATRAVLARIERLNPQLNAFCHLAPDEALRAAQASEQRCEEGLFQGNFLCMNAKKWLKRMNFREPE